MKTVVRLALILMIAAAVPSGASAQTLTPEKRADIERLLEVTGALAVGQQMAVAVAAQFGQAIRKARPDIPRSSSMRYPRRSRRSSARISTPSRPRSSRSTASNFTGAEIKELIRFYSTDVGRKTVRVMPALVQESMAAGQQWGQALAPQIDARVRARFKKEGIQI